MSVYLTFSFVLTRTPNLHLRLGTAVVGQGEGALWLDARKNQGHVVIDVFRSPGN